MRRIFDIVSALVILAACSLLIYVMTARNLKVEPKPTAAVESEWSPGTDAIIALGAQPCIILSVGSNYADVVVESKLGGVCTQRVSTSILKHAPLDFTRMPGYHVHTN